MARLQPGSAEPRPGTGGPGHDAHDQAHTTIGGLNRTAFGVNLEVAAEVSSVLDRRAALEHPPPSLAISDPVALAIAGIFRSETPSGRAARPLPPETGPSTATS